MEEDEKPQYVTQTYSKSFFLLVKFILITVDKIIPNLIKTPP